MIFRPRHCDLILAGEKTQTRRLVRESDQALTDEYGNIIEVRRDGRLLWLVGQTYAIQPGRGKHAIGRLLLQDIRREHLHEISEEDAKAEGAILRAANFAEEWENSKWMMTRIHHFEEIWNSINTQPGTIWNDNPEVWVLRFLVITL